MRKVLTHGPDILEGHLGGCSTGGDNGTYYPLMWSKMIENLEIKSVIDVGCGRGFALEFFKEKGLIIQGVEGSTKAVKQSLVPENVLLHDYEKGSPEIKEKFDLCWCCEFVEHVEEKFRDNFIETFKNAKYLAITFAYPGQGGHHHVNENTEEYWINAIEAQGFSYDQNYTLYLRDLAKQDAEEHKKNNSPYFIPHFVYRGLFFTNDNC